MTKLMQEVIDKLKSLPADRQDQVAALILDELNEDERWDESLNKSQDVLAELAEKARADIRAGRVREIGIDEL